jgi:hypothetical protein
MTYQQTEDPHIDVDINSSPPDSPKIQRKILNSSCKPSKCSQECVDFWATMIIWCAIGLTFLALGTYYQVDVCAKYPDWPNVWCNTTEFRTQNTPFSGITGLVKVDYLDGTCHSPEFQVFSCTDYANIANCVAAGQLNFNSGSPWPCYLEQSVCDDNVTPSLNPPDKNWMPGCVKRTAFFVTGGILTFLFISIGGQFILQRCGVRC